jgi:hypothetical protein
VNRRGFLAGVLAAGIAPAIICTPGILMPVRKIAVPQFPDVIYGEPITLTSADIFKRFDGSEFYPSPLGEDNYAKKRSAWMRKSSGLLVPA